MNSSSYYGTWTSYIGSDERFLYDSLLCRIRKRRRGPICKENDRKSNDALIIIKNVRVGALQRREFDDICTRNKCGIITNVRSLKHVGANN